MRENQYESSDRSNPVADAARTGLETLVAIAKDSSVCADSRIRAATYLLDYSLDSRLK